MRIGMISTSPSDQAPRLAVQIMPGKVLDIDAATREFRARGMDFGFISQTLKAHIANLDAEKQALERLVEQAKGLAPEDSDGFIVDEADVRIHAPISDPEKFLCVGKNYRAHLDELVRTDLIREIPNEPTGFIKLNSVIAGTGDEVARPDGIVEFDYEPELAFVISKPAYRVSREDAHDHIFGFTLFNDLTAREIQRREVNSGTKFWTAKNMPNFGPIGPWVVTMDEIGDFHDLNIDCLVNGEHRMRLNTSGQINKPADIIEHFSKYLPLYPGDLFATGSDAGVAVGKDNAAELFLRPGDVVDVILEDVMTLSNIIIEETPPHGSRG